MREILFRGKRKDNGKWVYGFITGLCGYSTDKQTGEVTHIDSCYMRNCCIDANTVGQYTGLPDKNGKKIFEGDIVILPTTDEYCVIQWSECDAMFSIVEGSCESNFGYYWGKDVEVIGNIHDNPELLESED